MKTVIFGCVFGLGLVAAIVWVAQSPAGRASRGYEQGASERASPGPDRRSVAAIASPNRTPSPPAAPSPANVRSAPGPSDRGHDEDSEAQIMSRLHDLGARDAALTVDLARRGNALFPDGPGAPERASILIHALASQGKSADARGEAEEMVNRYPDSDWVREIERFTGAHRHRNIRVNGEGGLEYY